jgi:hypothetical protein
MRRLTLLLVLALVAGAARAEAITIAEIIELSKTGLSDEVLLALVEIENRVFPVDPETVKALKGGGVSERVIAAIVRHGRAKPLEPVIPAVPASPDMPPPPPQPQVVVIEHREPRVERVREVPVAVPVYVPVYVRTPRHRDGVRAVQTPVVTPGASIGLPHGRIGLSPAPPVPTSDPPYWKVTTPLPRRSDPPGWKKSPYLKP